MRGILFLWFLGWSAVLGAQILAQNRIVFKSQEERLNERLYQNNDVLDFFTNKLNAYWLSQAYHSGRSQNMYEDASDLFAVIVQKLLHKDPEGALLAQTFMQEPHRLGLSEQMAFYLAVYYFNQEKYKEVRTCLAQVNLRFLSNQQILSLKFYQAYMYFIEEQFEQAFVLFDAVRQVQKENPVYYDALYYYAFLELHFREDYERALWGFRLLEKERFYKNLVPYYIAYLMYFQKQKQEALVYINQALAYETVLYRSELLKLSAYLYFEKQDYAQTIQQTRRYQKEYSLLKDRDIIYALGYSYYQTQQLDSAVFYLKQVEEPEEGADALFYNAMYNLGNVNLQLQRKEAARAAFSYCIRENPNAEEKERALFLYAQLSLDLGFSDRALSEIKTFMSLYPNSAYASQAQDMLLFCYANSNDYKQAYHYLQQMSSPEAQRLKSRVYYGRAIAFIYDGMADSALGLLEDIIRLKERNAFYYYAYFWKGLLLAQAKEIKGALKSLERCLDIPSEYVTAQINPLQVRYHLAGLYFTNKNYAQALVYYAVLERHWKDKDTPEYQDVLIKMADAHFLLKHYETAAKRFARIKHSGSAYRDYATYQLALLEGIKDARKKIFGLLEFLKTFPESAYRVYAYVALGNAYLEQSQYAESQRYFEKILSERAYLSRHPMALLNLGLIAMQQEYYETAITEFKRLHEQFPKSNERAVSLEFMKEAYSQLNKMQDYIAYMKMRGYQVSPKQEDSLLYADINAKKRRGKWREVVSSAHLYLHRFSEGYYRSDIYFLLADYYETQKKPDSVLYYCKRLTQGEDSLMFNHYTEDCVYKMVKIFYDDQKDYRQAVPYLQLLYRVGGEENKRLAVQALLKSYYQLSEDSAAYVWVRTLEDKQYKADASERVLMLYFKAKHEEMGRHYDTSIHLYRTAAAMNQGGALAAEMAYKIARLSFEKGAPDKQVESLAFDMITRYASYEYWVILSYILLGDIYSRQKDWFNAKATYKSIVDNTQIDSLKQLAAQRYEATLRLEERRPAPQASGLKEIPFNATPSVLSDSLSADY